MFGKNLVPELWTEKTEKWDMFDGLYFENEKRYQKSDNALFST